MAMTPAAEQRMGPDGFRGQRPLNYAEYAEIIRMLPGTPDSLWKRKSSLPSGSSSSAAIRIALTSTRTLSGMALAIMVEERGMDNGRRGKI